MQVPPSSFSVKDVVRLVGRDKPLDVIDVATQAEVTGWTLGDWGKYFNNKKARTRVLNVLSLEFSNTPMAKLVRSPRIVRSIDWVDVAWPLHRRVERQYPAVQYYCLMSVEGSFTDFHIDFGGTSVWYHVLHGAKRFYFIAPTEANLSIYQVRAPSRRSVRARPA